MRLSPFLRACFLLLCFTSGLAACGTGAEYLDSLSSTAPAPARSEHDAVIAAALHYAFEEPGDVPDGHLLPQRRRVVLCEELDCWGPSPTDSLTAHALLAGGVEFVLLDRTRIEALARASGRITYGVVGRPEIGRDSAAVFVGVHSLRPSPAGAPREFSHGGAGYRLRLVRGEHGWRALGATYYVSS